MSRTVRGDTILRGQVLNTYIRRATTLYPGDDGSSNNGRNRGRLGSGTRGPAGSSGSAGYHDDLQCDRRQF